MNQNLWEEKILSIIAAGDEIDDILYGKDTASPPMPSSIPTPRVQDSSDAGQAPAVDTWQDNHINTYRRTAAKSNKLLN